MLRSHETNFVLARSLLYTRLELHYSKHPYIRRSSQILEHLKSDQLDQKAAQLKAIQLQNEFALLRYLLFSSVAVNPPNQHTFSSLAVNSTNLNLTMKLTPFHRSPCFPLLVPQHFFCLIPRRGLWDHPKLKQPFLLKLILSLQLVFKKNPPAMMQNLYSRICKLEQTLKSPVTLLSQPETCLNTPFFTIRFANFNLAPQIQ